MIQRPSDSDPCGQKNCRHPFGEHYATFDGEKTGCSHYNDNQRDGGTCFCDGFAVIYRYPPQVERTAQSWER